MMVTEVLAVGPGRVWGTWEELVLGGAVIRHGTQDWNVVASELRSRASCSFIFTPEACKAKYEDLQQRYSGSRAWFEELRKRRVAELKQELARSDDSIGSLKSKIKTLEADKRHSNQADYYSSQTESALPSLNSDDRESLSKETSKHENSAGSFTIDTRTRTSNFLKLQHQSVETDTKPDTSVSSEQDRHRSTNTLPETSYGQGVTVKKRRGQRKRKDCNPAAKEGSVGENEILGSTSVVPTSQRETSTNDCGRIIKDPDTSNNHGKDSCFATGKNLMEIFNSIAQTEPASVFKHRMDSQKRARYRKIIRQHVDLNTIRSRIVKRSITSVNELFSDLLLLANNALVFYSRRTREYKSANSLRDLVMEEFKENSICRESCQEAVLAFLPCNPPVKPRSARRRPPLCKDRVFPFPTTPEKTCDSEANVSLQSLLKDNKGLKRGGEIKTGFADQQPEISPVKQRKRKRR